LKNNDTGITDKGKENEKENQFLLQMKTSRRPMHSKEKLMR